MKIFVKYQDFFIDFFIISHEKHIFAVSKETNQVASEPKQNWQNIRTDKMSLTSFKLRLTFEDFLMLLYGFLVLAR